MKSDVGNYEFCKILCRNGHWRGPVCRGEIDDIKGKDNMEEVCDDKKLRGFTISPDLAYCSMEGCGKSVMENRGSHLSNKERSNV